MSKSASREVHLAHSIFFIKIVIEPSFLVLTAEPLGAEQVESKTEQISKGTQWMPWC